jgi:predicted metal-dependent peptidase
VASKTAKPPAKIPVPSEGPISRRENVTPHLSIYEKIDEARYLLLKRQEYLAHGVHALMQPRITKAIPTAGVGANKFGGVEFFFNPNFIESLTVEELAFVMAHEAMHVLADHIKVRKPNHMLWNICCDVIVNTWLQHSANFEIGNELKEMTWDAKKIDYPEYQLLQYISADDLYDELEPQVERVGKMIAEYIEKAGMAGDMQQPSESQPSQSQGKGKPNETLGGSGQKNDPNSPEAQGKESQGEQGEKSDQYPHGEQDESSAGATPDEHQGWGSIAESAGETIQRELKNNGTFDRAQKAGKCPAGLARAFENIDQDFAWEKHMERFMASVIKREDTWERPNRRLIASFPDTILPGTKVRYDYQILVYADMSGSIGPDEVARFVSVLKRAPKEVKINAYSFDTRIYDWKNWQTEMPRGGGGTSFSAVVDHAERVHEGKYDGVVVLTDGYDSEPSPKRAKNWMWVSTAAMHTNKSGYWVKMPESGKLQRRRR